MPQSACHHRFGGGVAILRQQVLFQGTAVHPDANGNLTLPRCGDDLADLFGPADIAGIEAQTVDSRLQRLQCQAMVEVDVGNEGDVDGLLDLWELFGGFPIGNCDPYHFAPDFRQALDLGNRGPPIAGVGVGHGLHHNRRPAADGDAAEDDPTALLPPWENVQSRSFRSQRRDHAV